MIINGSRLLSDAPLSPMVPTKERAHGTSYGLAEAGVDIRVKQTIAFVPPDPMAFARIINPPSSQFLGACAWIGKAQRFHRDYMHDRRHRIKRVFAQEARWHRG